MPANRPKRPPARDIPIPQQANTTEALQRSVSRLEALYLDPPPRTVHTVDLVVGTNRIPHGLGRRSLGAVVVPTVASAAYAYAYASDGDLIAVITVIGAAQPGATVEVF